MTWNMILNQVWEVNNHYLLIDMYYQQGNKPNKVFIDLTFNKHQRLYRDLDLKDS